MSRRQTFAALGLVSVGLTPSVAAQALKGRSPDDPKLVWTASQVVLGSRQVAPGVFAVYPDDATSKNAAGVPVATSGGFVVENDGVLVVDTMLNRCLAQQLLALVAAATSRPIRQVVNTSYHGDHSYGNQFMPKGAQVIQHVAAPRYIPSHFADDVAFMKQYFSTNQGLDELRPQPAQKLIHDGAVLDLDLGDKRVSIRHPRFAQTPGDLFVWVSDQKVLFTGNPVVAKPPAIPWLLEGHLANVVTTLHTMRNMVPADAIVVPGHGVPVDATTIDYAIRYLEQLSAEVGRAVRKNQSEQETVAAVTMQEYAGCRIFPWVHSQINVPAAYRELKAAHPEADLIVHHAAITTLDSAQPAAQAVAVKAGRIVAVGSDDDVLKRRNAATTVVDAAGRRLVPGLNDSHAHYLRGGLSFNYELRWDGVPSLQEGLDMIRKQAAVTPPGQWVRVVAGFTPWQFGERQLPTPEELTVASPDRPVLVQYFYSVVILNRTGLAAFGIDRTQSPRNFEFETHRRFRSTWRRCARRRPGA